MEKQETIKSVITEILEKIGVEADVSVETSENAYTVLLKTESNAPLLIGRYGDTLAALQRVCEAMLYKRHQEPVNILINVNDYREKQKERLEGIAENIAQRVLSEKVRSSLRSFSSYERKVMHEYISKTHSELVSFSDGEGQDRTLNIDLKENAPAA